MYHWCDQLQLHDGYILLCFPHLWWNACCFCHCQPIHGHIHGPRNLSKRCAFRFMFFPPGPSFGTLCYPYNVEIYANACLVPSHGFCWQNHFFLSDRQFFCSRTCVFVFTDWCMGVHRHMFGCHSLVCHVQISNVGLSLARVVLLKLAFFKEPGNVIFYR